MVLGLKICWGQRRKGWRGGGRGNWLVNIEHSNTNKKGVQYVFFGRMMNRSSYIQYMNGTMNRSKEISGTVGRGGGGSLNGA